jgi:hypothetical protein
MPSSLGVNVLPIVPLVVDLLGDGDDLASSEEKVVFMPRIVVVFCLDLLCHRPRPDFSLPQAARLTYGGSSNGSLSICLATQYISLRKHRDIRSPRSSTFTLRELGLCPSEFSLCQDPSGSVTETKAFPELASFFTMMRSLVVGIRLTQILLIMLAAGDSLRDIKRTFDDAGVVPDVLPTFHPSALLQVTFPNINIVPGQNLTKEGISRILAFISI